MNRKSKITFGKYRDKHIGQMLLDEPYCDWLRKTLNFNKNEDGRRLKNALFSSTTSMKKTIPRQTVSSFRIGNRTFSTKKDRENFVRQRLHEIKNTQSIVVDSSEDFNFILNILKSHKSFEEKCGQGIKAFKVFDPNHYGGNQVGVKIIHPDETETSFSWTKCVNESFNQSDSVKNAFRKGINDQITTFFNTTKEAQSMQNRSAQCAKCKCKSKLQVDHSNPTFSQIFNTFISSRRLNVDDIAIRNDKESLVPYIQDKQISDDWMQFHLKNAQLRLLCQMCNSTRPKYGGIMQEYK